MASQDHNAALLDLEPDTIIELFEIDLGEQDGVYRISLTEWTIGDINGGGAEILYKTYNGDIIIKKR